MDSAQKSFIDAEIFKLEAKIPVLKKYLQELIAFSEKNRKFKAGTETIKEKMIISFEVSYTAPRVNASKLS